VVWPKDLALGMLLDFSISAEIRKKAHTFKVTYSVNGIEKPLGTGEFKFSENERDQDEDLQTTIFVKSMYRFESCGKLSHCVKIYDASGNEIIQASPPTELLIKEHVIPS
jgi:hypothetical protein